jgi:hypothetical protein
MGASRLSVEPPERGFQSQLGTGKAFAGGRVPWETGERVPSMRALSGRLSVVGPEIRNRVLLSVLVKLLLLRLLKKSIEFLKLFFIQAGEGEFRWTWF